MTEPVVASSDCPPIAVAAPVPVDGTGCLAVVEQPAEEPVAVQVAYIVRAVLAAVQRVAEPGQAVRA